MTEAAMIEFLRGLAAGLGDTPPNAEQWKAIRERLARAAPVVAAPPVFIPTTPPPAPVHPWPGYPFGTTIISGHSAAIPNTTCCAPNPTFGGQSFVVGAVGGGALPSGMWGVGDVAFGGLVAPGGASS